VLEAGYATEYWIEVAGFRPELTRAECALVLDILSMFRMITFSVRHLTDHGTAIPEELTRRLEFRGFDHNDPLEGHMASYVDFMIDDDKWQELRPQIERHDGGNSHSQVLDVYSRMLAEFRRLMDGRERLYDRDAYFLSLADLGRISDAQVHPSNRRAEREA
jgi:uncharacterized protein YfbU (UPF0304 family)